MRLRVDDGGIDPGVRVRALLELSEAHARQEEPRQRRVQLRQRDSLVAQRRAQRRDLRLAAGEAELGASLEGGGDGSLLGVGVVVLAEDRADGVAAVGLDEAARAPLIAQDILQQPLVSARIVPDTRASQCG